jgi:hypothetical protein
MKYSHLSLSNSTCFVSLQFACDLASNFAVACQGLAFLSTLESAACLMRGPGSRSVARSPRCECRYMKQRAHTHTHTHTHTHGRNIFLCFVVVWRNTHLHRFHIQIASDWFVHQPRPRTASGRRMRGPPRYEIRVDTGG